MVGKSNNGLAVLLDQTNKEPKMEMVVYSPTKGELMIAHEFTVQAYLAVKDIMADKNLAAKRKAINYAIEQYYPDKKRIKDLEKKVSELENTLRKMGQYFATKNEAEQLFSECSEVLKKMRN